MGLFSMANLIVLLEKLLDTERTAILEGQIGSFQRFAQDKERLLAGLSKVKADPGDLQRVQRKAERNQELLAASARGLKAATQRLEKMTKREDNLRTYSRDGASATLTRNPGGVNRRA